MNQPKFNHDSIYLSIYCLKGCSIILNVDFPTIGQGEKRVKRKKKKADGEEESEEEDHEEIPDSYFLDKIKSRKADNTDYLQKNMYDQANFSQDRYNQLIAQSITKRKRIQSAQKRKEEIEEFEHKKKYFLIHKWDIVRQRRTEMQDYMAHLRKEKRFKKDWLVKKLLHKFLK